MDAVNIDKSLCDVQEQNKLLASYTSIYWPISSTDYECMQYLA
jgi:hypothetical protein